MTIDFICIHGNAFAVTIYEPQRDMRIKKTFIRLAAYMSEYVPSEQLV